MCGFKLLVIIVFKATKDPNKYDPLSPIKILALGKLKTRKEKRITICPVIIHASLWFSLSKFMNTRTMFIIIR